MTLNGWKFKEWTTCGAGGDTTSKLLAKHDLNVVGYWVPTDSLAWDNTFTRILAHPSREEAKRTGMLRGPTRRFKR
jgi:hypothetical protein